MRTKEEILDEVGIDDDTFFTYGASGFDSVEEAMQKYAEQFINKWISVNDRLPEKDERVIVIQNPKTTATRKPLFAIFNGEKFEAPGNTHDGIHLSIGYWVDIIYWQPLPEPPKP